ncbi:hypothetical protein Msi02_20160 [Microbispora siamensis]|uniref:Uncharacterized protein n=1 Tax=Microbispora siamensis TaxID=564413 RepID=A0ABQ4GIK6_9ACTN|nr:hypothetical protein Msi02_20160 [Microbispora siamensis]
MSYTSRSQPRSAEAHTRWISESVPSVSSAAAVTGQPSIQPDSRSAVASRRAQPSTAAAVLLGVQRRPEERRELLFTVLDGGDLVILSLTDYDAMYAVLEPAAHR